MNQEHIRSTTDKDPIKFTRRGKLALLGAGIYLAGTTVFAIASHDDSPDSHFSPETVSHMVEPNETVWNLANEVEGSNKYDHRVIVDHIENMPENKSVFKDNILDQGEIVEIPISVE